MCNDMNPLRIQFGLRSLAASPLSGPPQCGLCHHVARSSLAEVVYAPSKVAMVNSYIQREYFSWEFNGHIYWEYLILNGIQITCGGFRFVMGVPQNHPFRTMGFSLIKHPAMAGGAPILGHLHFLENQRTTMFKIWDSHGFSQLENTDYIINMEYLS